MRSVEVIEERVRHSLFSRLGLLAAAIVGFSLPPVSSTATPQAATHEVSIRLELVGDEHSGRSNPDFVEWRMVRQSASDSLEAVPAEAGHRITIDWSSHALC
jgi:hypothetical protein